MNYVPLNEKQEQSIFSLIHSHPSRQQKAALRLPKPQFDLTANGHSYQHSNRIRVSPHTNTRTSNMRPPQTLFPFSTVMPVSNASTPLNNVQKKLAALTLRLEKELENDATVDEYYGQCTKCGRPVTSSSDACQAMGELYHNECFKCVICSRILRGKAFYRIHDQVYCEEDYLVRTDK